MYSNIENVNILTSVLKSHGVRRVVVCPGSRNAPLVHNFNEAEGITCYPVTDERSAGFMALGMSMAGSLGYSPDPVAVCVTSGSALLNVYPAVAEAYYQKLPIIVISADRPEAWIGQQDGQTLPQAHVFGQMVNRSVDLPMITPYIIDHPASAQMHDEQAWYCERQAHEAVIDCVHRKSGPVHINIHIAEPLYEFTQKELPHTHWVDYVRTGLYGGGFHHGDLLDFLNARRPMIVVGQDYPSTSLHGIKNISSWAVTLIEPTALGTSSKDPASHDYSSNLLASSFEEVLARLEKGEIEVPVMRRRMVTYDVEDLMPDFILYVGGTLVSKRLKQFLRRAARSREQGGGGAKVWRVSKDGEMVDTFMHIDRIFQCDPDQLASAMTDYDQAYDADVSDFKDRWFWALRAAKRHAYDYEPPYSSMAAVKYFQQEYLAHSVLGDTSECRLFYGNSMPIRLAGIYACQYVHCCRGVNGIEGTLSAAAGLSVVLSEQHHPDAKSQQKVFCVLGDLSFFYDQNALWNKGLRGNLRVILLNNHCGGIFRTLPGLDASAAADGMVAASHSTEARGICTQNDVGYLKASNMDEMQIGVVTLLTQESERPMVLEVFTDAAEDARAMKQYFESL